MKNQSLSLFLKTNKGKFLVKETSIRRWRRQEVKDVNSKHLGPQPGAELQNPGKKKGVVSTQVNTLKSL